jgi:hypothetical protein
MAISEQQLWGMDLPDLKRLAGENPKSPEEERISLAFSDFQKSTPDFRRNDYNLTALCNYLPVQRVFDGLTADDFRQAHALAVYQNRYNAAPGEVNREEAQQMWEMPIQDLAVAAGIDSGTSADPAWSIPLAELEAQVKGGQVNGE